MPLTFGAPDPHDSFKADLSAEVALEVPLQLLSLRCVVEVVEGRVVEDAARRVFGHTRCTTTTKVSSHNLTHKS